jgi:hypothetical protein
MSLYERGGLGEEMTGQIVGVGGAATSEVLRRAEQATSMA